MTHIEETTLELYVLGAEEAKANAAAIEEHVKLCRGCAALLEEIKQHYDEAASLHQQQAETVSTEALTLRSMIVRVPPFTRDLTGERKTTLPARAVLFVIRHYAATSLSLIALITAAVLLLVPKTGITDTNPSYARAKDEFLLVYNHEGNELWRKHIGIGYDFAAPAPEVGRPEQTLVTANVDGDGNNEILAIFGWYRGSSNQAHAVICYNADGSERWRYEFHRQMTFGQKAFPDNYGFITMMVGDFDNNGNVEVVAVARHLPLWPSVIVRLDASDGTFLSEYWHAGWISGGSVDHRDIDGDGIEEFFFGGENNSLNIGMLAVFDARWVEGYGPNRGESFSLSRDGIPSGSEKYYITFPQSDIQEISRTPRNHVDEIEFKQDGSIQLSSGEVFSGTKGEYIPYRIFFYFDAAFRCMRVVPMDEFVRLHQRWEKEGKLRQPLDEKYLENLRRGVQYWDGEKFVKEPTMNKRYVEITMKRPLP